MPFSTRILPAPTAAVSRDQAYIRPGLQARELFSQLQAPITTGAGYRPLAESTDWTNIVGYKRGLVECALNNGSNITAVRLTLWHSFTGGPNLDVVGLGNGYDQTRWQFIIALNVPAGANVFRMNLTAFQPLGTYNGIAGMQPSDILPPLIGWRLEADLTNDLAVGAIDVQLTLALRD